MHSVRLEPTKLILTGTRTTYQATGDAGWRKPQPYVIKYAPPVILSRLLPK